MRYTKINSKYKTITCSGVKSSRKRGYSAYVPLLYFENNSTHSCALLAKRLATMIRIHSKIIGFSVTYFHKSGFELPIVVSCDTCLLKIQSCVRYTKNNTGSYAPSHQLIIINVIALDIQKAPDLQKYLLPLKSEGTEKSSKIGNSWTQFKT